MVSSKDLAGLLKTILPVLDLAQDQGGLLDRREAARFLQGTKRQRSPMIIALQLPKTGPARVSPPPRYGTGDGAQVITLQAERLARDWARRFEAEEDCDPFEPGGPWS